MTQLDIDFVRAQFPAFQSPELDGWAFFENAGGSYPCRQVVERLHDVYINCKVQPYWAFPASARLGEMMDDSRVKLSRALGVAGDEVSFGPSTTQNTYVLAQAFRQTLSPGDEIIVTNQDHEANTGAWRRLADEGFTVREWQVDPATGMLDPEALDALLTERTRLVCFPHASNIVAAINPVAEITAKAHAAGAVTVTDGVSYAPHGLPDVGALGSDVYLFSSYKTYGPHQGVMVVRRALADRLVNQAHGFNADGRTKRFTPAGPDHAQIAALGAMVDYFDALSAHHGGADPHDLMRGAEIERSKPLLDWLSGRNNIRLIGPEAAEDRAPTFAILHERPGEELAAELAGHKIMCGGADFYSPRVLQAMGIDPAHGVLRVSMTHYTSADEVDRLIAALDRVL
ncbi:aminotransferase class V-fold PLP-dependent enzyme [Rhodobacteraceae bacterium NNCM2]|nr:aminotransferase class V-fold PLP-dependent enzyme [Coraliihabitans acroporae]